MTNSYLQFSEEIRGLTDGEERWCAAFLPGERLQTVIYNEQDTIVRRFEQVRGECIAGYVDFFLGPNCRPAQYLWPLVDIDPEGNQTILVPNFRQGDPAHIYFDTLARWVRQYGIPQKEGENL